MQMQIHDNFKCDVRRIEKEGRCISKLWDTIDLLMNSQPLSIAYQDNTFFGEWEGIRAHIEPDWILLYEIQPDTILFYRIIDVRFHNNFKRDLRRMKKRRKELSKLWNLLALLVSGQPLPTSYRDHTLSGEWQGVHDVHIEPDWILLYEMRDEIIILYRTGTHSDLNLC